MTDEFNEAAAQKEWDAAVSSLAPSDEGVVISDEPKAEAPTEPVATQATNEAATEPNTQAESPKEEPKKVNLGGLSTDELLRRVREQPNDPDTIRAVEIRLRRQEASAAGAQKTRRHGHELAQQAVEVRKAIQDIETEYPDLAKPLQKLGDFAEQASKPFIEQEQRADQEAGKAHIESAFPGFMDVIVGQDFKAWVNTQPAHVQALAAHGGPGGAIDVLSLYEQHAKQSGNASPFEPKVVAPPPPPAVESVADKAARIAAERKARLQQSSPIPSGAVSPKLNDVTDEASAWNAGVNDVAKLSGYKR